MCDSPDFLPEPFLRELQELEEAYLTEDEPTRQSGFRGGERRWRKERAIILKAVEEDGDFIDVGCANGYLVECLVRWAKKKGIALTPYGVDQGARLVELAKQRLPAYASHFWVANAWAWSPPRTFRYVYTLYDCVPEHLLPKYIERLLARYVEDHGTLIVGAYGSYSRKTPARDIGTDLTQCGFQIAGRAACGELPITRIAWIRTGPRRGAR